jgi:hypothetical protein
MSADIRRELERLSRELEALKKYHTSNQRKLPQK